MYNSCAVKKEAPVLFTLPVFDSKIAQPTRPPQAGRVRLLKDFNSLLYFHFFSPLKSLDIHGFSRLALDKKAIV